MVKNMNLYIENGSTLSNMAVYFKKMVLIKKFTFIKKIINSIVIVYIKKCT